MHHGERGAETSRAAGATDGVRATGPSWGAPTSSVRSSGSSTSSIEAVRARSSWSGEPGIGKTRLLRELAARAEPRGHLVLSGSASELERDLPFSVFVDALDEYVESLEPNRLAALDDDVQAELAHVFPSLSALAGGREVAPQHERYRSHRAVRALLEHLAQTRPLVLVLDDFHWADSASVELLGALLRRPPAAAVLIAVALRPRQTPERLAAALERAHREAALTRIELGALTLRRGSRVSRRRGRRDRGGRPLRGERRQPLLPRAARPVARARRPRLPPLPGLADRHRRPAGGRRLAERRAGAAVGRGTPGARRRGGGGRSVRARAGGGRGGDVRGCGDGRGRRAPAARSRSPDRRAPAISASGTRSSGGRSTRPRRGGWRLGAHERCAEALAARGAAAAARAHHVERSARQGDLAAVAVLREAGEAAARLAPASAARWFGGALRLLPQTAPAQERVELLLARAGALAAAGHFADSHEALLEALAIVPDESSALRTTLATACAGVEHRLGRYEQAHARLVSALGGLPEPVSVESVELLIELR